MAGLSDRLLRSREKMSRDSDVAQIPRSAASTPRSTLVAGFMFKACEISEVEGGAGCVDVGVDTAGVGARATSRSYFRHLFTARKRAVG